MINSILLAISVSIDSFGIGITYGIRNTKIQFLSKFILFIISLLFTYCSFIIGNFISSLLSLFFTKLISSFILFIMGIIIIFAPIPFDFDHSKGIDIKESLFLGIALSLDSVCVGIGSSIGGYSSAYFPFLVSIFQLTFIVLGMLIGKKIIRNIDIPDTIWNYISGSILILFAIIKFFI